MSQKLLLFDAYSLIYRAFYAIRFLTGPQGQPVNAIFGFTKMLRRLIADHQPTHTAVAFDLGPPRQRLAVLPTYKAQRPPTPPDLDAQLPAIRDVLDALRLPVVEIDGEEADDLIATLARQADDAGWDVLIASNDKDFMQLIGPRVQMLRPDGKETAIIDAEGVRARYGVLPDQMIDFLSLLGDAVDNIPGVAGVGEKTAAELLRAHHSLDAMLSNPSAIAKPRIRDAIIAHTAQLRANRELIQLQTNIALPAQLDSLALRPLDAPRLAGLFRQFGFKSLTAEMESQAGRQDDLFGRP